MIVGPLTALVLVLAAGSIVLTLLLRSWRLKAGGFTLLERRQMRREGSLARAKVLDSVICNLGGPRDDLSVDHRVVLEVYRADGSASNRVQLAVR